MNKRDLLKKKVSIYSEMIKNPEEALETLNLLQEQQGFLTKKNNGLEQKKYSKEDCIILEVEYLKIFDRVPSMDNEDMFPYRWVNMEYDIRCEILKEAISNHIHINETSCYQENMRGKIL